MKLVIEPLNLKHAFYCIEKNIDAIILGNNEFSVRNAYNFCENEILDLISKKNNTKIFIKLNSFFFENEIDKLTNYLINISKWNIDGVIFSDFSVPQICLEQNINLTLKYNPDTLATSYYQFPFYKENNFKSISLTRELSLLEIKEILDNKIDDLEVEIQGHGYLFIMHSRWKLISNFEKYYQINLEHEKLKIKEELRKLPNYISEDNHGTHMFSGYQICTIDILDEISRVDWLRIDCINMNEQEAFLLVDLYQNAIELLKCNLDEYKLKSSEMYEIIEKNSSSLISHSFLGKMKDLLHMEKTNE